MTLLNIDASNVVAEPIEGGYTWTLASRLGHMLREAEEEFGSRDKSYTVLGVEFSDGGPQIWYPGGCGDIVIQLDRDCLANYERACYQLSHEAVHLLSPLGWRAANNLEEGLAVCFSCAYTARHGLGEWSAGMSSYVQAGEAVKSLLTLYPGLIKRLREKEPTISRITGEQIRSVCPDVDSGLTGYLCSPFERE